VIHRYTGRRRKEGDMYREKKKEESRTASVG